MAIAFSTLISAGALAATHAGLLVVDGQSVSRVEVGAGLTGARSPEAATFWEETSQDLQVSGGAWDERSSAHVVTYGRDDFGPATLLDGGAGADEGCAEAWVKQARPVGRLSTMPAHTDQRFSVEVPPGLVRASDAKASTELRDLARAELDRSFHGDKVDPADLERAARLSAKFTGKARELWYVASWDELHLFVTIYTRRATAAPKRVFRFDFAEACE